ncbi:helix-turn-helix transcriptional regulator [Massilia oculi]|uniref:helix-turn-helix transcriptional regulator n=1 Tax=Massilia oculi TaxID=945844 RepID=UPI001AAF994F|nr:AlpA family phage regulatory protein [Massilia oculi]
MTASFHTPLTILRRKQVEARTGLSRSTIYDKINRRSPRYDPTFPTQVRLSRDAVGWIESEVDAWIASRIRMSRASR